jgi:hypothetical protein
VAFCSGSILDQKYFILLVTANQPRKMQTQEVPESVQTKVYGGMRNMPLENKHLSIIVSSRLTSNPPAFITDKIGMVNPQTTGDSL